MHKLFLITAILAGCVSGPLAPSPDPSLAVTAPGAWSKEAQEGWYRAGDRFLHLRATHNLGAADAPGELDSLRAGLNRRLEAQVDPYYGTRAKSEVCDPKDQGLRATTPAGGTRQLFFLAADKDRLIDCYSAGTKFRALVEHLYCPGTHTLFEIEYFTPYPGPAETQPVADCR